MVVLSWIGILSKRRAANANRSAAKEMRKDHIEGVIASLVSGGLILLILWLLLVHGII
jgi:hypothetical protein